MKTFKKIILIFFVIFGFNKQVFSSETINIGLLVPLSGEYKEIGNSIVNSIRLALNSIDNKRISILPRDTKSDPAEALKVAKELYTNYDTKIIIGPIFNSSTKFLINLPEVTFLSFTNKLTNNKSNVISTGVNAVSQIEAIKKFQDTNNLERTFFLVPNNDFKLEIENAISKTKIKLKDKFVYDSDPTKLTAQIEKITRYPQRKQNLIDEIERLEKSNDPNKEVKIEKLEKKDTLGGINFDSIIIADFDENLKSVATSLLYTDVSSKRVNYISLNQWFDRSLLEETSLQPIKSQKFFGDECIGASAFVNGQLYFSPTNPDISLSELSLGYVPNGKENAHSEPAYWLFNNALYVVRMRRRKIFCEQTSCADPEEVMLTISLTAVSHVKLPSFIMLNRQKFDVDHIEENQYQVAFPLKNTGQRISLRIRANADFIVNDIVLSSEDVAVSILNSKKL